MWGGFCAYGAISLGPSHRDLNALLDRLETEGFIMTEQNDGYCENGGAIFDHGSGGIVLLRAA